MLVRFDERFSRHIQFLGSYALSSNAGFNGTGIGFNLDNWFDNYGPLDRDQRHVLNLSGVIDLPARFQVSFSASYYSKAPFTAYVGGVDFNGDGTLNDPLPGTKANQFNRSLGKSDLARLVDQYNQNYAGKYPKITLPASYEFGDNFITAHGRAGIQSRIRVGRRYKETA